MNIVSLELLIAFLHPFVYLGRILDRIKSHVGLLNGTDLCECLVKELVNLSDHLRAVLWSEDPCFGKQGNSEGQEPSNLELMLVLPRLLILIKNLEK